MIDKIPVFVISGKDPLEDPGGYAAYAHNLCKVLTSLGHPVYIIALGKINAVKKSDIGKLHLVPNIIANALPLITFLQMAALPFYSYSFFKKIDQIVQEKKIEKYLVWGIGPWGLAGAFLKRKYKEKLIFTSSYFTTFLHEMRGSVEAIKVEDYGIMLKLKYFIVYHMLGPIFTIMERFLVQSTDFLITHYISTKNILYKELKTPKTKLRTISYYTEIFKRETKTENSQTINRIGKQPFILTICRQDPRKGINILLHAVKILVEEGIKIHCVIIGTGNMLKPNKNLAKKLKIENYVEFLGFVRDCSPFLKHTDIFAFPAVEEGSGSLSILEAMSVGAPIVVTNCDGITEDIQHEKSGIVTPKMYPYEFAGALKKLITNKKLAMAYGKNAKKRYNEKFSFERMKKNIRSVLEEFMSYETI